MPDYKNGKIYKIVDANEEMIYVGSTTQTLSQRMTLHRSVYKSNPNALSCHAIFDKYGVENTKILLLELCPCDTKEELLKKEGEHIKLLACVNKRIEGRTQKEYNLAHKEQIKEQNKEYKLAHKEQIKEQQKQYDLAHADKIKEYKKQYALEHAEKIREYKKQYYLKKKLESQQPLE